MKKLRISCALYNVFLQVTRGITTLTRTVQARIKQTMQTWRRRMDASAQTHRHVSTDAYMCQTTRQAGKDFSFVMQHYSFALCGIVMLNKINSQVWGSPIIPCLNKRMKDINRDKFGNMGSTSYAFIRQKSTSHFWRLENKSLHFNKQ